MLQENLGWGGLHGEGEGGQMLTRLYGGNGYLF